MYYHRTITPTKATLDTVLEFEELPLRLMLGRSQLIYK